MKITDIRTRRNFLSASAGAIATGAALESPQDKSPDLQQMASELYKAVAQFSDENAPTHVQVCNDGRSLNLAMDVLLDSTVQEIYELLSPLFAGGTS